MLYRKENALYAAIATQEFSRLANAKKTHVIQMRKPNGEVVILTKPNTREITRNSLVRFRRFMDGIEMVEVQKGKKKNK